MSKIRFSKEEQARLRTLIAVEKVSDKTLVFTQAFKRRAVLLSRQGKTANQIFREAGIDINLFPARYFHHVIKRWKKSNLQDGIKKGRPSKVAKKLKEMSIEELKARVAYLEAENDFLKKLKALGMGINPEDLD